MAVVARGIAEHGNAFGHWAKLIGTDDLRLDQFEDAYEGHYPDLADYGESVLVEGFGLRRELEEVTPELLAGYVEIHVAAFGPGHERRRHDLDQWRGTAVFTSLPIYDPTTRCWTEPAKQSGNFGYFLVRSRICL